MYLAGLVWKLILLKNLIFKTLEYFDIFVKIFKRFKNKIYLAGLVRKLILLNYFSLNNLIHFVKIFKRFKNKIYLEGGK